MNNIEIEAYKVAVIYEQEYRKAFVNEQIKMDKINFLPQKSDPRKSYLFRYCYKMIKNLRGLIDPTQYRDYISGNILIIKQNNGVIKPNCLSGDKAWFRYKVYDRKIKIAQSEINALAPRPSSASDEKICIELDATKHHIHTMCMDEIKSKKQKMQEFYEKGIFKLWTMTGKLSPYYLILSPLMSQICDTNQLLELCPSSKSVYEGKITEEVKNYFKSEFLDEF